jgi:TRAP-type mannitol/chloroaromatic compound transport system substrate-binding protein
MERVKLLVTLVIVMVLGLGSPAFAKKIRWKMATSWPAGILNQRLADMFATEVRDMSGGRLEIKVYPGGKLIGALEVFDAVRMGTIDIASSTPAYWIGKTEAADFFRSCVFGMEAIERLAWMYEGEGMELYHEMYAKFGFGAAFPMGILWPEGLAWSNKPIRSMDDFEGLKFRTSGYWGEILAEAGASVVMLPGGEVYEGLQRKVIDAAEFATPGIDKILAFYEISNHMLVPGVHQPSSMMDIIINKRSWEKLPADLKAIVKNAAMAITLRSLTIGLVEDTEALEFFKEKGLNIEYLDPEIQHSLRAKAYALMEEKGAKDPFIKRIWESQRKFQEKVRLHKKLMTPIYE